MSKISTVLTLVLCLSLSLNPTNINTRKVAIKSTLAPTLHAQIIVPATTRLVPPETPKQPDKKPDGKHDINLFMAFAATKAVSLTSGIIQLFFLSRTFSLAALGPASGLAMLLPYLISIPMGRLADKKGKLNLMIAGVLLQTSAFIVALCCNNIAGIFVYYMLFALALNIFMLTTRPFGAAMLKQKGLEEEIPDMISRVTALSMRVSAVSSIVGSAIAGIFGMEIVFVLSSAISALALVFLLHLKKSHPDVKTDTQPRKESFFGIKNILKGLNNKNGQSIKRALLMDILLGGELSIFICFFAQPMLLETGIGISLFGAIFFVLNWIESFGSAKSTKLNHKFKLFSRTGRIRVFLPLLMLAVAASGAAIWSKIALICFFALIAFAEGVTGVVYDAHIQSKTDSKHASSLTAIRILVSGATVFAVQTIIGLATKFIPLSTLLIVLMGFIFVVSLCIPDIQDNPIRKPIKATAKKQKHKSPPVPELSDDELKEAWAKNLGLSKAEKSWAFEHYSYKHLKYMVFFLEDYKNPNPRRILTIEEQRLLLSEFFSSQALLESA